MLPGASGLRWMPRKIAGIEMITIEPSIVAIVTLSVVLDRAIHLYRSGRCCAARVSAAVACRSLIAPTLIELTAKRLLYRNYLLATGEADLESQPPGPGRGQPAGRDRGQRGQPDLVLRGAGRQQRRGPAPAAGQAQQPGRV